MKHLARLRLRWHVLAIAFIAALPEVLNLLGSTDLHPILSFFMDGKHVDFCIALLPFVLAFLRPLVHLAKDEQETDERERQVKAQ